MTTALAYGPQTDRIETLLAAVREMTPGEVVAVRVAVWTARRAAAGDAAWTAARTAVRDAVRGALWSDALCAAGNATLGTERRGAWDSAWDAVAALVVLDLVGQYGLTRKHIDALAAPILSALPHLGHLFESVDIAETEPHS
jgi:hypothetical protein